MSEEPILDAEHSDWNESFAIQACRFLDGDLDGKEFIEFQSRLRNSNLAREQFTTIAYQQNCIREGNPQSSISKTRMEVSALAKSLGLIAKRDAEDVVANPLPNRTNARRIRIIFVAVALGAVLIGIWGWSATFYNRKPEDAAVAKVSATLGSDFFQHIGGKPRLELAAGDVVCFGSGAVEVEFPDRATVVLTGPAKMRVDSVERATLLFGRLSAKVSELGKGFVVETPDAEVTDLGTEFSVAVSGDGATDVKVHSGLVDVASLKKINDKTRLKTGDVGRVSAVGKVNLVQNSNQTFAGIVQSLDKPDLRVRASRDSFVMGGRWAGKPMQKYSKEQGADEIAREHDLLVKHDIVYPQFNRIAVIGFELPKITKEQLLGARLLLTVLPNDLATEKGRAGHTYVPSREWQFVVEGVWDHSGETWDEQSLTWNNAPGINPYSVSGELLGRGAPMQLGEFSITGQGQAGLQIVIDGKQLVDFLKLDDDGNLTLLVRRRTGTIQAGKHDITVHGFASRENGEFLPPTLELWLSE